MLKHHAIGNADLTRTQSLPVEKYKCEICKHNFSSKHNLKVHMENVHEGLKRFTYDKCAKKFTEKKALTLHIKGVHEKIKEFNCDRCNKKFSKGYNLKVHVQTVHEKERNFICQKGFGISKTLQKHSVRAHSK